MEDDMILPEGFESLPADEPIAEPQTDPVDGLEAEGVDEPTRESTEPVEASHEPPTETPQMVKLKVDRGEKEVTLEEAILLAQKGTNYERAVERAAQDARDAVYANMGYEWNGRPITTEAEYKQALAEKELMDKYQDRDLPEEVIQELMESRRDREERQKEKATREEQEKKDAEFTAFFDYFQRVNERGFDPAKDTIPAEVKEAVQKGESLKGAYMEYHNKELRNQLKIAKKNAENLQKAPVGSVTANGGTKTAPEDDFMRGFNSLE